MRILSIILLLLLFAIPDSFGAQLKDTIINNDLTLDTAGTLILEGATADAFETTVTLVDPTADRTITLPNTDLDFTNGFDPGGAIDIDYGSADITDHTFSTDGTGTAEVVLPAGSIDSTEILDNTIANADMADNSINSDDYVDGSIDLAHMSSASVDSDNIVNDTIANADMADNSIDSDDYVDASIDLAHMSSASVDSDNIVDAAIDFADIKYDNTLAGNPALAVDEIYFFADSSGPGFISEGSTADTAEQLYRFPDQNGSDTTEYIVIADDGNVSAAEAGWLDGVTSAIQTQIDTKAAHAGQVYTGNQDHGGAVFEITNSATPTTDATGEIALDTTITDHQPLVQYFDGGENMTVIAIDTAQLPALDNEIIKYDAAADKFVLEADAGGGSGAFSDSSDPIVQNTITKDVHIGDGAGTLAGKFEVGGDADQPQVVIEAFSTQTDSILIVQNDADTELFSIETDGSIIVGGTAQSTFTEGVVVNDGSGGDADDDFRVETNAFTDAFLVDASDDVIRADVTIHGAMLGMIKNAVFQYTSSTTTTPTQGWVECNGSYYTIAASAHTVVNFTTTEPRITYLMVDDSASTPGSNAVIVDDDSVAIVPVYSASKMGFYSNVETADRIIGVVKSASSTTIEDFGIAILGDEIEYHFSDGVPIATDMNPTGAYVTPDVGELSTFIPVNATGATIMMYGVDTGSGVNLSLATKEYALVNTGTGQDDTQYYLFSTGQEGAGTFRIKLDESLDVRIAGDDNGDDGTYDATLKKFTYRR